MIQTNCSEAANAILASMKCDKALKKWLTSPDRWLMLKEDGTAKKMRKAEAWAEVNKNSKRLFELCLVFDLLSHKHSAAWQNICKETKLSRLHKENIGQLHLHQSENCSNLRYHLFKVHRQNEQCVSTSHNFQHQLASCSTYMSSTVIESAPQNSNKSCEIQITTKKSFPKLKDNATDIVILEESWT